ncbi:hypothetical protein, partial [Thiolapillus sp.]
MATDRSTTVFVAPVAIDVGAAHTGVFRALYQQGQTLSTISERYGEVLTLNSADYTLLMRDRTAKRHMRRGFDRRKMTKRLLFVILEHHFGFPARDHAQALGFLLNRRGFTRLEGEYNAEALEAFPEEAWSELPKSAWKILGSRDSIGNRLRSLIDNEPEKIAELRRILVDETIQPVEEDDKTLKYIKKLIAWAKDRLRDKPVTEHSNKQKNKFPAPESRIAEHLKANGVQIFDEIARREQQVDLAAAVQELDAPGLKQLQEELEPIKTDLEQRTATVWKDINPGKYDTEKIATKLQSDKEEDITEAHLHNLVYAIAKAHEELSTGSRHRRQYFEEIKADINNAAQHPHKYMQAFASAVQSSDTLDENTIYRLIAHLSNLELKPLRAYFNDAAHKGGDQWQPEKLAKIVSRWFMNQWRVNAEKDDQATVERYGQLRQKWTAHPDKNDMIAFWLDTDPALTIPPYQSQTNRRPPDCQSLILNGRYMQKHHPNWRDWLEQLDASEVPDLTELRSRKGKPLLDEEEQALRRLQ